jgi:hypothetical protein
MIADYDRIRDAIEGVFPDFKDFNTRIRTPGGFRLPLPPTERKWLTPNPARRSSCSSPAYRKIRNWPTRMC